MPVYLLDTDVLTHLAQGHAEVCLRVAAAQPGEVQTTAISLEEQLSGWYSFLRTTKRPDQIELAYAELIRTTLFLASLPLVNFTVQAIARYESLLKQKLNVRKNDLRIAAIALEGGAVVVTRNVRDFGRVPNLVVEDWTQPATP
ncbi:MAG TPA: type II toxin-antitoxin system VapC family toxin [Fimbriiglobus sp.]|jgi:tRNA(fMet)-specific endonuclease VapC|nr:type II toxin-antitoxin system VapC family toxin [Fimbriiglobus sp.]